MTERTREAYERAFEIERAHEYPVIDAFEQRMGFAVDRDRLEAAARVLACPIKKNPPNWQHGRVIYALARSYLAGGGDNSVWLDVGTAKGFSTVCMCWALEDAKGWGTIVSFDIIAPNSTEPRNSVDDCKTVVEFVNPYMLDEGVNAVFFGGPAASYMNRGAVHPEQRIGFAFIDGSHTYDGVKSDIRTVTPRQQAGDIIMFDDLQVRAVARAVSELNGYAVEVIRLMPSRIYAIAVKQ